MVAGASRLGETSGSASSERSLHLEELPAFRMSSPKYCRSEFWHHLRGVVLKAALSRKRSKKTGLVSQGVTEEPGEFSN
jgi:hypothetical protein